MLVAQNLAEDPVSLLKRTLMSFLHFEATLEYREPKNKINYKEKLFKLCQKLTVGIGGAGALINKIL